MPRHWKWWNAWNSFAVVKLQRQQQELLKTIDPRFSFNYPAIKSDKFLFLPELFATGDFICKVSADEFLSHFVIKPFGIALINRTALASPKSKEKFITRKQRFSSTKCINVVGNRSNISKMEKKYRKKIVNFFPLWTFRVSQSCISVYTCFCINFITLDLLFRYFYYPGLLFRYFYYPWITFSLLLLPLNYFFVTFITLGLLFRCFYYHSITFSLLLLPLDYFFVTFVTFGLLFH